MKSIRTFSVNRKARFNYEIVETFEAGLALLGTEIKAIREGRANIGESYARTEAGEMWVSTSRTLTGQIETLKDKTSDMSVITSVVYIVKNIE